MEWRYVIIQAMHELLLAEKEHDDERPSRDQVFMSMAKLLSFRGTCQRTNVGCVLERDNRIISIGYTGAPAGLPHCLDAGCHIDPDTGGCIRTLHAEANAITWAAKSGTSIEGCTVYTTLAPCLSCAKIMVTAGVKRVIYLTDYRDMSGLEYLRTANIAIIKF